MDDVRPPTRSEKRIAAREARRAAQRAATLAAAEARKKETKEGKFKLADGCTIAALPLGYAAMISENNLVVGVCFALSGAFVCAPVTWHHEIALKFKAAWCVVVALLCFYLFSIIRNENFAKELARREGVLEAGNDPSPDNCGADTIPNSLIVNAGSILLQITKFPYVLLTLNGERNIVLDREPNGHLRIKRLVIFDDRNDKVVKIDNDEYWIHPNSQWKHPSRSKVSVSDHSDREVLSLNFRNPNSLVFRAQINSEAIVEKDKRQTISFSVTDDAISAKIGDGGPASVAQMCLVNFGFAVDPKIQGLQLVPGSGAK